MVEERKPSNVEVLSRGSRFRRDKKQGTRNVREAVFDDRARFEYLTGFQRRNKERKQAAAQRHAEAEREEKRERRREKRKRISAAVRDVVATLPSPGEAAPSHVETHTDGLRTTTVEIVPLEL